MSQLATFLRHREPHMSTRGLWLLMAGMCLAWALAYLPWLAYFDLQFEEPRRALIARTMLSTGEFLVPQLAGEIYTAKPPLFNWLLAGSATLHGGLTEWSARIPSAVCTILLALLFVWGTRHWLRPWALTLFGASLILAPEILAKGRIAEIEPLFNLLVGLSLGAWFVLYSADRRGLRLWLIPLLLVALAYLTKREPALVFFYFAVTPFLIIRRQWRLLFEPGHIVAAALAAILVGGWLFSIAAQTGWLTLWTTLQEEVLQRGLTGQTWGDIASHIALYPVELFVSMLPFALLLPLLAFRDVRRRVASRFGDRYLFCVLAVLVNLPVYWFRGDVAVRYFLPMFPFVLLLAAMVFDVLLSELEGISKAARRYVTGIMWSVVIAGLTFAGVLIAVYAFPSIVDGVPGLLPAPLLIGIVAACTVSLWALTRSWKRLPVSALFLVFLTTIVLGRTFYFHVVVADRMARYADERNAPRIASDLTSVLGPNEVAFVSGVPWAVWYYVPDGTLREISDGFAPAPGTWLLINERERSDFRARGFPDHEEARYVYRDDVLLLGRAR